MDATTGEAGDAFGHPARPLFEDPTARALSRVGVVDVGSNSVRLVIFDGAARSPAYFYNEKVMAGLGRGLSRTGRLDPDGRRRALAALRRFVLLAEKMGAGPLTAVATAAMRDAADGPEFRAEVRRETGLDLRVIGGAEEARLTAQGVLLGWPGAEGVVCDIGGSSMEIAEVGGGRVGACRSSPLGPFKLAEIAGGRKGRKAFIDAEIAALAEAVGTHPKRLYLVGGSWRAIARLDMARRDYPLLVLHEYRMTPKSVRATLDWIAETPAEKLRARTGTSADRMALVPYAAEVLKRLIRVLSPKEIDVSSYGIREGLLFEQMPDRIRQQDPLIESCRFTEAASARMPGTGRRLFGFLRPIFRNARPERQRLIKAACLLHDTSWRANPDYRAEVCFDNATRANLGGLDHEGRVFLGVALMHRYKNTGAGARFSPLVGLLEEDQHRDARVLGKAMRFGAMFASDAPDRLAELKYQPRKKTLELVLTPEAEPLYGEVAESRFAALAKALGVERSVRVAAR